MRLHLWNVFVVLICLLFIVGCSGTDDKENIEKQNVKDPVKDPVAKTPDVPKPQEPAGAFIDKAPEKPEPKDDPTAKWESMGDTDWAKIQELYVTQYIDKPESITWALRNSIPKTAAENLEKGYGMFWNPMKSPVPKDLEVGIMHARRKMEEALEEDLMRLEKSGRGSHYYLLAYVASWHYCMAGKNDKAKALIGAVDLFNNLEMYGIIIPKEQVDALKQESAKAPKTISASPVPATPQKIEEKKPVEVKPEEKKPEEVKPEEKKPEEKKPEEVKPEEKKPEEKKPEEVKPEEKKPEEKKPEEVKPEEKKPEEKKPEEEDFGFDSEEKKPEEVKPEEKKPEEKKPEEKKPEEKKPEEKKPEEEDFGFDE